MLRMGETNKIRKCFFTGGESRNEIAKKFNRSWATIDRILSLSREELEQKGKHPSRFKSVMTPKVIEAIESYLKEEEEKKIKKRKALSWNSPHASRALVGKIWQ